MCNLVVVREEMTPLLTRCLVILSCHHYFKTAPVFWGVFFPPQSKDEEVWILLLLVNASQTKASARDHWFLSAQLEQLFLVETHCFTEQEVALFFSFHTHAAI